MNEALLIVGHGSRDQEGTDEFLALGRLLAARQPGRQTATAFLEFARPTISEAIDALARQGAERIVCQPAMLLAAGHVRNDVPREVQAALERWPHVTICVGGAIDVHERLLQLCRLRWDDAHEQRPARDLKRTLLLVAGRGATDPDANTRVEVIARRLGELYGVAAAQACFSGLARPLVPDALDSAVAAGFERIVVQPYFLFTGVLVKQVHKWTRACAERHPSLEVFATPHLGVHPLLADAIEDRAHLGVRWPDTALDRTEPDSQQIPSGVEPLHSKGRLFEDYSTSHL